METKTDLTPAQIRRRILDFESDIQKNKILNVMNRSAVRNYKKLLAQLMKK